MKLKEFGVQLGSLVQKFGLEVVYAPENFEKIEITKDDVKIGRASCRERV